MPPSLITSGRIMPQVCTSLCCSDVIPEPPYRCGFTFINHMENISEYVTNNREHPTQTQVFSNKVP